MAKKDDDLIAKLTEVLARLSEVLDRVTTQEVVQVVPHHHDEEATDAEVVEETATEPTTPPVEEEKKVDPEDVRNMLIEIDDGGKNRPVAKTLLAHFKAKVFKDLKESDYAEFILRGSTVLAAAAKKAKEEADKEPASLI